MGIGVHPVYLGPPGSPYVRSSTPQTAVHNAEYDWTNDSENGRSLNADEFHESLFEMADIWCTTVEVAARVGTSPRLQFFVLGYARLVGLGYNFLY